MPCSSTSLRRCSSCDEDCRCGCQSNIYSLPWEILEKILEYEDPVTLLSIERTCRMFFSLVSSMWMKYCKKKKLFKPPTALCLGFDVNEDSLHSYDKTTRLPSGKNHKFRLMAVRSFLMENRQCVVCRTSFTDDVAIERFTLSYDVLLCPRCLQYFSITITHEVIHLLNDAGVETTKMHFAFGPLLFSSFIKRLRAYDYDEKRIFEHLKPHIGNQPRFPLLDQLSPTYLPSTFHVADNDDYRNNENICTLFNRQQGCSCILTQCSSVRQNQPVIEENPRQISSVYDKKLHAISLLVFVCNIVQLVHSSVIVKDYKMINIGSSVIASFVLVAFIDIVLIFCVCVYILWSTIRRFFKHSWNRSFTLILRCLLLSCFLLEINQILLMAFYAKNITTTTTNIFVQGIPQYTTSQNYKERIDWIQNSFYCCGFTKNVTRDWLIINNTTATSVLPDSCCSSSLSNSGKCSIIDSNSQTCPFAVYETLFSTIKGFLCTTVCCAIIHLIFIMYIVVVICRFKPHQTNADTESVRTIFTMM